MFEQGIIRLAETMVYTAQKMKFSIKDFFSKCDLTACNFNKKRLQHMYVPVNIVKFLRTAFFTEHFRWLLLVIKVGSNSHSFYTAYFSTDEIFEPFVDISGDLSMGKWCLIKIYQFDCPKRPKQLKSILMQIWKSPYVFLFIQNQYLENLSFLILRILELFARDVCKLLKK